MAVESWYAAFGDWVNQFPTSYPPKWDARRYVVGSTPQGPIETFNDSSGETYQVAETAFGRPRFREDYGINSQSDFVWSEEYPEEYGFPQGFIFQSPQTALTHWWNFNPALADNPIWRIEAWNGPADNKQDYVHGTVTLPTEGNWQSTNSLDYPGLSGIGPAEGATWGCVAGKPTQNLIPGFPEDQRQIRFQADLSLMPANVRALFEDVGNWSHESVLFSLHFVDPPEIPLAPDTPPHSVATLFTKEQSKTGDFVADEQVGILYGGDYIETMASLNEIVAQEEKAKEIRAAEDARRKAEEEVAWERAALEWADRILTPFPEVDWYTKWTEGNQRLIGKIWEATVGTTTDAMQLLTPEIDNAKFDDAIDYGLEAVGRPETGIMVAKGFALAGLLAPVGVSVGGGMEASTEKQHKAGYQL